MQIFKKALYVMAMVFVMSCQDEISFESENLGLIVVDGFITDAPETHTVRLATSAQFDSRFDGGVESPVTNALASIENGSGESVVLIENRPGFYDTPHGFQALVGETYVLCIQTQDGQHYQSTPQELRPSGSMGNVYFEETTEKVLSSENIIVEERRVNFYSDFSFPDTEYYYMWDWEGVYIHETTYFTDEEREIADCPPRTPDIPEFCYVEQEPDGGFINILESEASTTLDYNKFLILSSKVNFDWKIRYSMLLKQYSMTRELYDYWKEVEEQTERTGSIFDPVPSKIRGNVSNVNNADEEVLGYFGVYGVQETRLFVPGIAMPDSVNSCLIPRSDAMIVYPEYCCDCRAFDVDRSKAEKPEFWIDG